MVNEIITPSQPGRESVRTVPAGQMPSRLSFRAICCASVLVWLVVIALLWPEQASLLHWDEVDYVNAAKLGVPANAWDIGSLSPREFLKFGLSKVRGESPALPDSYDEQRDPFVLRHHHPPLVIFLLSTVARSRSERVMRS